jgi:Predicted ATPase (AAA+ superfamily)
MDTQISFPVGRVEYMALRPCTFTEFLGAMGETELQAVIKEGAIPEAIHPKAMSLFNTYTLIGGMPEAVEHYVKNRDLVEINDVYETLLESYSDDVEKYAQNQNMKHVIRYILKVGWPFAAQSISLGSFAGSSYRSREMGEAFRTLEKAMLLELVYPTVGYTPPVCNELKRSPKLLWLDVGLVNYSAKLQKEVFGSKDILDAWRGHIAEQVVAQELLASDFRVSHKRNFWVREKKGSEAEVDFIVQHENKIIPVEVKSGHNAKLKSLHAFMENTNHDVSIRVWSKPFSVDKVTSLSGKEFNLINLPFYYVGILDKIVAKFVE